MSEVVEDSLAAVMKRAVENWGYQDVAEVEDGGKRVVINAGFGAESKAEAFTHLLKKWGFDAKVVAIGAGVEKEVAVEITEDRRGTFDIERGT